MKIVQTLILWLMVVAASGQDTLWLENIDLSFGTSGWKNPIPGKNIEEKPFSILGKTYQHGVGVHAVSAIYIDLDKGVDTLFGLCGADDLQKENPYKNSLAFFIISDGDTLWKSDTLWAGMAAQAFKVSLKGRRTLALLVDSYSWETTGTYGNWVDCGFITNKKTLRTFNPYSGKTTYGENEINKSTLNIPYILTPKESAKPIINAPKVYGATPGSPFFYYIPITGTRPIKTTISNLPKTLYFDDKTGVIKGTTPDSGDYQIAVQVQNKFGKATHTITIKSGSTICLTPPMGWNSWNCFGPRIDQETILNIAKIVKSSGLADYGYSYINIDDGWQGNRHPITKALQGNSKFPDMKALCDSIHALGLKVGVYSTPWATSYMRMNGGTADDTAGNVFFQRRKHGVYSFHEQDAKQFAEWGVDYLKYDWAEPDIAHATAMSHALRNTGRDIVYSISGAIHIMDGKKFTDIAHLWRTNPDITDTWESIYTRAFFHQRWNNYVRPGSYSDPDMFKVGWVGIGKRLNPTKLTADEQYTHISLWAMFSSPFLLGCDLTKLDDFTLNLIANKDVIAINQDALVSPAEQIKNDGKGGIIYTKKMADSSLVVGFFNTSDKIKRIAISTNDLGLPSSVKAYDIWRQKEIVGIKNYYEAVVNPHGVVMIRVR